MLYGSMLYHRNSIRDIAMPLLNISPPRFTSAARCLARRYSASVIPHYVSLYHCKTLLLQPSQFLCYTSHNYIAQFFALPLHDPASLRLTFALPINPYNRPALLYHTFAGQYFSLRCLCYACPYFSLLFLCYSKLNGALHCLCFTSRNKSMHIHCSYLSVKSSQVKRPLPLFLHCPIPL